MLTAAQNARVVAALIVGDLHDHGFLLEVSRLLSFSRVAPVIGPFLAYDLDPLSSLETQEVPGLVLFTVRDGENEEGESRRHAFGELY